MAAKRAGQVHEAEQEVGVPLVADLHPWAADELSQRPLHHVPVGPSRLLDSMPRRRSSGYAYAGAIASTVSTTSNFSGSIIATESVCAAR